jgi:hypothetical protein
LVGKVEYVDLTNSPTVLHVVGNTSLITFVSNSEFQLRKICNNSKTGFMMRIKNKYVPCKTDVEKKEEKRSESLITEPAVSYHKSEGVVKSEFFMHVITIILLACIFLKVFFYTQIKTVLNKLMNYLKSIKSKAKRRHSGTGIEFNVIYRPTTTTLSTRNSSVETFQSDNTYEEPV